MAKKKTKSECKPKEILKKSNKKPFACCGCGLKHRNFVEVLEHRCKRRWKWLYAIFKPSLSWAFYVVVISGTELLQRGYFKTALAVIILGATFNTISRLLIQNRDEKP